MLIFICPVEVSDSQPGSGVRGVSFPCPLSYPCLSGKNSYQRMWKMFKSVERVGQQGGQLKELMRAQKVTQQTVGKLSIVIPKDELNPKPSSLIDAGWSYSSVRSEGHRKKELGCHNPSKGLVFFLLGPSSFSTRVTVGGHSSSRLNIHTLWGLPLPSVHPYSSLRRHQLTLWPSGAGGSRLSLVVFEPALFPS